MEGETPTPLSSSKSGIDKKKYKMLKAAFKEERQARVTCEIELNRLVTKLQNLTTLYEEMKDKNLQLYDRNNDLEERIADLKTRARAVDNPYKEDSEHMKEMLGTQSLLREEMKEKEFFKGQAKETFERIAAMESEFKQKEKMTFNEVSELRYQITQVEKKNQNLWDELEQRKAEIA